MLVDMPDFHVYMLRCAKNMLYVGHTDDLVLRMAQHQSGAVGGYTSERLPVTLIWSTALPSRHEAFVLERQIKRWSRAKKLALARSDWKSLGLLSHAPRRGPAYNHG